MFEVKDALTGEVVKVYDVKEEENGTVYFLVFTYKKWQYEWAQNYLPVGVKVK